MRLPIRSFLVIIALGGSAFAQQAGDAPADRPVVIRQEGEYSGVKPGVSPFKPPRRNQVVYWVGFQPRNDGTSQVFVQLSSEVTYSQRLEKGVLYVKLEGVRYRNRNARRRLDTRFFDTTLKQVTSKRVRKRRARKGRPAQTAGIELKIEFKDPADAAMAMATMRAENDGYHYLLLDFARSSGQGSITVSEPE